MQQQFRSLYNRGPQIFQNSRSHLKILGARRVKNKFRAQNPQILYKVKKFSALGNMVPGI